MECRQFADMLEDYATGDLAGAEARALEEHLRSCASCREEVEAYRSMVALLTNERMLMPTLAESAALTRALDRMPACTPKTPAIARSVREVVSFALATVAAFAFLVVVLGLQALGRIDLVSEIGRINPLALAGSAVVIVFVTSFIPILVTARRRPLNGMTFSR